jgi:hypothetical protein
MGDDLNVLRVNCAVRTPSPANTNATLLLLLTVKDSAFAMAESAPDAVAHRSQMWNCRNETILDRLRNATLIDAHSITLLLDFQGSATVSTRATLVMQGVVAFPPVRPSPHCWSVSRPAVSAWPAASVRPEATARPAITARPEVSTWPAASAQPATPVEPAVPAEPGYP